MTVQWKQPSNYINLSFFQFCVQHNVNYSKTKIWILTFHLIIIGSESFTRWLVRVWVGARAWEQCFGVPTTKVQIVQMNSIRAIMFRVSPPPHSAPNSSDCPYHSTFIHSKRETNLYAPTFKSFGPKATKVTLWTTNQWKFPVNFISKFRIAMLMVNAWCNGKQRTKRSFGCI